jgi:ribonucleoside-diphosphate reductase beta chain
MSQEVFTEPWVHSWADELESSSDYRRAAAKWEGSLMLEMTADLELGVGESRGVFLDLWHGDCREARVAEGDDRAAADYVICAGAGIWKRVLGGELEPLVGLMTGKLELARGSLLRLTPYARASRELVRAATRVASHFPYEEKAGEEDAGRMPALPAPVEAGRMPALPAASPARREYQTTGGRGLDHRLPPMRLWQKSKRMGIWNPLDIDFEQDVRDWRRLSELEREVLLHLTSQFQAGEESVTLDLLPLIQVIAAEGRLEEEMYLTAFLFEEAKHVEVFRRFLDEVAGDAGTGDAGTGGPGDLTRFHGPCYRAIFYEALPRAMARLRHDPSPAAQAEASTTYNMIVEGVLAETGYHAYHAILERHDLMPGMRRAVAYLKADESRHLAFGVYLLSRLVAEHGDGAWRTIEARMGELLPMTIELIHEMFGAYDEMPFGLDVDEFTEFAMSQFRRRLERVEKARRQSLEEVYGIPIEEA